MNPRSIATGLLILFWISCSFAYGATFRGKIIDADTKQPIEGAVVVVSWLEETSTLAGPSERPKEVKECLTDKNGEWEVQGPAGSRGGLLTTMWTFITGTYYTEQPDFVYFKPGYCSYPAGYGIEQCKGKIIFDNNILQLPRLRDRRQQVLSQNIPVVAAGSLYGKTPNFTRLWKVDTGYVE